MLLNSVDDLIKYLGRAVMSATTDEFLRPYIEQAQEDIFERALGMPFLVHLDNLCNDSELIISDHYVELLRKVQRSLAWYAYSKYLPYSIGNDGDNGLQELGTDNTQPVRIGVLDRRIRETEKNAVNSLESLLQYLELNLDSFPEYRDSDHARNMRALLIPSATVMSEFLPIIEGNYRLFLNLKPYIQLAERDYILPRLGRPQYDRLKAGLKEINLTSAETDLLFDIRRALAHTAYWIGLPHLQFSMQGNGNIRVLSDFDGIYNSKAIDNETIVSLVKSAETEAKKWQNALRKQLDKNIDKFPLYAQNQASKDQPANRLPDNSKSKKIFRMK